MGLPLSSKAHGCHHYLGKYLDTSAFHVNLHFTCIYRILEAWDGDTWHMIKVMRLSHLSLTHDGQPSWSTSYKMSQNLIITKSNKIK